MSNEWNNLSESYKIAKQKHIASIKHKKKPIIYKHIVIKKRPIVEDSEKNIIEIKNEFPILSKYHTEHRSVSFSYNKDCEKYLSWLNFKPITARYSALTDLRATSLEVNTLKGRPDLTSFLMNSRINLGKKFENPEKNKTLTQITYEALHLKESGSTFKFFYNHSENLYNVVVFGLNAPVSPCCSVNLIVQVSQEYGGRVICPHRSCVIQFINNFCISKNNRDILWPIQEINDSKKNKLKAQEKSELNPYQLMSDGLQFTKSITINGPADKFSAFTDPLQQLLNHHKRLSY